VIPSQEGISGSGGGAMGIERTGLTPAVSLSVYGRMQPRRALGVAAETGFGAVGIPAWRGDLSPRGLGESGRRDLGAFLRRNGLALSWLSAGARGRFTVAGGVQEDVDVLTGILGMAHVLRPGAVTAGLGALGPANSEAESNAREALQVVCEAAEAAGTRLALWSTAGEFEAVERLLESLPGAPAGILFDPGEILFSGRDPVERAASCRDAAAVRASDSDAERKDLAPGEGRVPWRDVLASLSARGYHGFVTVDFAAHPRADRAAARALDVLKRAV